MPSHKTPHAAGLLAGLSQQRKIPPNDLDEISQSAWLAGYEEANQPGKIYGGVVPSMVRTTIAGSNPTLVSCDLSASLRHE